MRELELENEFLKSPDLTLEAGASRFLGHVLKSTGTRKGAARLDCPLRLVYELRYIPLRRSHTPAAAISRSSVSRSRVTIRSSGK